jgi:Cu/Ag efflux protein CusF
MKPNFAKSIVACALLVAMASQAGRIAVAAPAAVVVAQAEKPAGAGTLNAIDQAKRTLNITHGPIAALHWPGMTMDFPVAPQVDVAALKPGAKIVFTLGRGPDGGYAIDEIRAE